MSVFIPGEEEQCLTLGTFTKALLIEIINKCLLDEIHFNRGPYPDHFPITKN